MPALPSPGTVKRVTFTAVPKLPLWLYQPVSVRQQDLVIVAVHGISREYRHQVEAYSRIADQLGCWLVVPEFNQSYFPTYQQMAKGPGDLRADVQLNTVMIALKACLKQPSLNMNLCGYSGGAQFAHRYALLYPQHIASLVLCSAGWYTFPDLETVYPYGLGAWPRWLGKLRFEQMLSVPLLVMVGEDDLGRDRSLRCSEQLDFQQGRNRVERATRWVDAMNCHKQRISEDGVRYHRLPNVGHDFYKSAHTTEMLHLIAQFWFEIGNRRNSVCVA